MTLALAEDLQPGQGSVAISGGGVAGTRIQIDSEFCRVIGAPSTAGVWQLERGADGTGDAFHASGTQVYPVIPTVQTSQPASPPPLAPVDLAQTLDQTLALSSGEDIADALTNADSPSAANPFLTGIPDPVVHTIVITPTGSDEPSLKIGESTEPPSDGSHSQLFTDPADGLLKAKLEDDSVVTLGGAGSTPTQDAVLAVSSGEDIADALTGAASPAAGNVFATIADVGGSGIPQGGPLTEDLAAGNNKITGLADGVDPSDAATVGQLGGDGIPQGGPLTQDLDVGVDNWRILNVGNIAGASSVLSEFHEIVSDDDDMLIHAKDGPTTRKLTLRGANVDNGSDTSGGNVVSSGGRSDGANSGGEAIVVGGPAPDSGGYGGLAELTGGTAADGGTPAAITAYGASGDSPGSHGRIAFQSANSSGTAGQALVGTTDSYVVWGGIIIAAGVPSGAPDGMLPFAIDTTSTTGGLYYWNGSAWVKIVTIP